MSICHKPVLYQNNWTNRIELVLAWCLSSTNPTLTLCYKEIWVSPKIRVLPSGTLSQTLDLKKFRHGKSIALPTTLVVVVVVVDGRARWRHLYDSRRVVAVYYKSVNCNPLTPLMWFFADLLYNLFLQLTRFWLTERVARSICDSRVSCFLIGAKMAW